MFTSTLTRSQLVNLYSVANSTSLNIQRSGTNVTLSWPMGTLLSAPAPTGPRTPLTTASLQISAPTNSQQFFRVRIP